LRMIHAGTVAESPEALDAWIARTDDLRATLTKGGYGSEFGSEDLFPLFAAFVAKATAARTPSPPPPSRPMWFWVAVIAAGVAIVIVIGMIVAGRIAL
jgi:hypothetical protein